MSKPQGGAMPIEEPGQPVGDLAAFLRIDERPELLEEFRQELAAVREAERP